uniref:Proline and serine rich 2 n=1 Tax=Oryzias latipes TaxID=8090 RepID=A0A3P9HBG7_ORYLA
PPPEHGRPSSWQLQLSPKSQRRSPSQLQIRSESELFILCWFLQKDDTLKYLSPEEQETLQFFEQTIDSLDDSLEEQENRRSAQISRSSTPPTQVECSSAPFIPVVIFFKTGSVTSLFLTDFRHMLPAPESHFEIKPRHESMASDYNLPTPNTPPDGHSAYHPPGSVPTPVLIAHQIAENQGGGTTSTHPSTVLRRLSLESEKTQVDGSDHPSRRGPPTSAKPAHLPANISMLQRSREHLNPSGSDETIHNRQESQSLVSPSEHYQQSIETKVRKAPTRSISFKDPTPAAPTRQEPQAAELNSYGGKSLTINPTAGGNTSTGSLSKSIKGPAPTPAPRPARHSYHGALSPPKPAQAPHPERRRSNSMFRPQGITVQFSGRGPMNDSRREALRKLGLLKT